MNSAFESEDDLVQTYFAPLTRHMPGALGLTDDCARLVVPPERDLVVTTDAVAAGVHFFATDAAADIAWKALAVNVSDLIAKGAEPLAYQMALSFPETPDRDWLKNFAMGLEAGQQAFGLGLLGGDTDKRPGPLTVTITAFGSLPKGAMVMRSGARDGDIVFVSGTLGDSALGLALRRDSELSSKWELTAHEAAHLQSRYLRPQPRLALRDLLIEYASAAMDISDGLVKDLERLCNASHAAAVVHLPQIPLSAAGHRAVKADANVPLLAITGGDDYEVLCTVPVDRAGRFTEAARTSGTAVTAIGTVSSGSGVAVVGRDGEPVAIGATGWDHFRG